MPTFVEANARAVTPVEKTQASASARVAFDAALCARGDEDVASAVGGGETTSSTTPIQPLSSSSSSLSSRASVLRRCAPPLDAFILRDVVSASECAALIAAAEAAGYSFWNDPTTSVAASAGTAAGKRAEFRNADTVEVHSQAIARELWARIKPFVREREVIDDAHPLSEPGVRGAWRARGVNDHLLFNKYDSTGHFSPHTDGATVVDFNTRSLYSVLVYLNDCDDGGETSMFAPPEEAARNKFVLDGDNRYRWPAEWIVDAAPVCAGTALIFRQEIPHEGAPVGVGRTKLLIRTDVMYEREVRLFDDAVGLEAYKLHQDAMKLEANGDAMGAMRLFRHCRRLCPAYADAVGIV